MLAFMFTFTAHMMYAFLLTNLMNFSRHHRQHLQHQTRHLYAVKLFTVLFSSTLPGEVIIKPLCFSLNVLQNGSNHPLKVTISFQRNFEVLILPNNSNEQ